MNDEPTRSPETNPGSVPEDLKHLIYLDREHRALICIACKGIIRPDALVAHLKGKHHVEWEVGKRVCQGIRT